MLASYYPQTSTITLTPFERDVVATTMQRLQKWHGGPVPSSLLAGHLGRAERTARYYLSRLEQAGLAQRPAGPRSGWMLKGDLS